MKRCVSTSEKYHFSYFELLNGVSVVLRCARFATPVHSLGQGSVAQRSTGSYEMSLRMCVYQQQRHLCVRPQKHSGVMEQLSWNMNHMITWACSLSSCPSSRSNLGKMLATSLSPPPLHRPPRCLPRPPPGTWTPRCPAQAPPAPSTVRWQHCRVWAARLLWPP